MANQITVSRTDSQIVNTAPAQNTNLLKAALRSHCKFGDDDMNKINQVTQTGASTCVELSEGADLVKAEQFIRKATTPAPLDEIIRALVKLRKGYEWQGNLGQGHATESLKEYTEILSKLRGDIVMDTIRNGAQWPDKFPNARQIEKVVISRACRSWPMIAQSMLRWTQLQRANREKAKRP